MVKVFVLNVKRENWVPCITHKIFGIKVGTPTPAMDTGDILLARLLKDGTNEYGVKGIWYFKEYEAVKSQTFVPWTDGQYSTILHFEPLILEFEGIFSEDFRGWESMKIRGLAQIRLNASVISLKATEASDYLKNILSEMKDELNININYNGREINLEILLQESLNEIGGSIEIPQPTVTTRPTGEIQRIPSTEIVGERLESPILNYAPLNELGVVLLFGFYMQELGFSHLEQIRSEFPDAIGMKRLPNGKLQRVRIEFEYKSKNFKQHNHDPNQCDIIVCWIHNWRSCPANIEVIELKSFIENLSRM